jgi:ParB/RepB/Spo0J family partition protein
VPRIPLAAIDANPDQPRRGEPAGIEELAASIEEYGLLQPIVVCRRGNGRYLCIAGHRRLAAYRWLRDQRPTAGSAWDAIPAIERDTPADDRLVLALLENLAREELREAEVITGLRLLHDLRQWSQAEIARRVGRTRAWVSQQFLVAGDPQLAAHVQTGQLRVSTAQDIRLAPTPANRAAALQAALEGAPRRLVRQLARLGPGSGGRASHDTHDTQDPTNGRGDVERANGPVDGRVDEAADVSSRFTTGPGNGTQTADHGASSGTVAVAAATPTPGARDLADVADDQGMRINLAETELIKLYRAALQEQTAEAALGAYIRLLRADLRRAEALVRAHARQH